MFDLFGKRKKEKNKKEFRFKDPEITSVYTCSHVLDDKSPILYASHDDEGDWQFLCGVSDHTAENAKIISLKEAVELDSSLNGLFEMPIGVGAERKSVEEKWSPFKL